MTTVQADNNLVKCSICLEQYIHPRKMANCGHSFCEACIVRYVKKLMEYNEVMEGIACPLCKTIMPAPSDKHNMSEWVKLLELTGDVLENITYGSSEPKSQTKCDSCRVYGISTTASNMCLNCFEMFCLPCSLGRHSGTLYKSHTVVDLDSENKGTGNKTEFEDFRVLREYSSCSNHVEYPIEYYCEEDDCLCCAACVVLTHRKCSNVICLKSDNLEKDQKTELVKTKNMIDDLSVFAKKIKETIMKFVDNIKTQSDNIKRKLQEIKTKVNSLLDALGEVTADHMNNIAKNVSLMQDNECGILNEALDGLKACMSLVDKTVLYGSVGHYYGIHRKVRDQIRRYKAIVMDAYERLDNVEFDLKVETALQTLLDLGVTDTNKLANITERRMKIDLRTHLEHELLKNYKVFKTAEKCVRENYTSSLSPTYSDLCFLRNNSAVLVDTFDKYCSITNTTYDVVQSCQLSDCFRCCIKADMIVVSSAIDKKIYVLCANEELKILREISTRTKPGAIRYLENGDIAVAWQDPIAFGIISDEVSPTEKTYFCNDKTGRVLKSFAYLAVDEVRKHIIQPCSVNSAIYCFDYEGNPKFNYANTSFSGSQGVALDGDGNIYVCVTSDSAIHVISPTGIPVRVVKEKCLRKPLAIAFMKNGDEFAVTRSYDEFLDDRIVTFFKLQK